MSLPHHVLPHVVESAVECRSPAYTINTLVVSFISFFSEEKANAAGVVHDPPATRKQLAKESVQWGRKSLYAKKLKVFSVLKNGKQTEACLKEATAKVYGGENAGVENKNGASGSQAAPAAAPSTSATPSPACAASNATGSKRETSAHAAPLNEVGGSAAQRKQRSPEAVRQQVQNTAAGASIDLTGACAAMSKKKRPARESIDLTAGGASGVPSSSGKVAKKASAVVDLT